MRKKNFFTIPRIIVTRNVTSVIGKVTPLRHVVTQSGDVISRTPTTTRVLSDSSNALQQTQQPLG